MHLFLQARSLLSASIRLNTIGPYAAQQMLYHFIKPLVDSAIKATAGLKISDRLLVGSKNAEGGAEAFEDDSEGGPSNTWPLGEILASRHDLQHSRIFNS